MLEGIKERTRECRWGQGQQEGEEGRKKEWRVEGERKTMVWQDAEWRRKKGKKWMLEEVWKGRKDVREGVRT